MRGRGEGGLIRAGGRPAVNAAQITSNRAYAAFTARRERRIRAIARDLRGVHGGPSPRPNEASFAPAPHSTSSSLVTPPLRPARRSPSRPVLSTNSGPSVVKG